MLVVTFDDHLCVVAMYLISVAFGYLYFPIGSAPLLTNRP